MSRADAISETAGRQISCKDALALRRGVRFQCALVVNKKALIKKIIDQLTGELELFYKAARAAHAEATHEQSKAENKYDTRGLEASYLARGQSKQAAEIESAIQQFEVLNPRAFKAGEGIELGALVELETGREKLLYFIGPKAGGTEVTVAKREILVITLQSPLGQQLIGRKAGERLKMNIGGAKNDYHIVSVE